MDSSWCVISTNTSLALALLLNLTLLVVFSLHIENIFDRIGATHEIGMVSIDVCVLNLYHVANHLLCRVQLLRQEPVHDFNDFTAQVLEARQLVHLNLLHNSSQLLVDEIHTLD